MRKLRRRARVLITPTGISTREDFLVYARDQLKDVRWSQLFRAGFKLGGIQFQLMFGTHMGRPAVGLRARLRHVCNHEYFVLRHLAHITAEHRTWAPWNQKGMERFALDTFSVGRFTGITNIEGHDFILDTDNETSDEEEVSAGAEPKRRRASGAA